MLVVIDSEVKLYLQTKMFTKIIGEFIIIIVCVCVSLIGDTEVVDILGETH